MANQPAGAAVYRTLQDTMVLTDTYQAERLNDAIVTPTGLAQQRLADALASGGGGGGDPALAAALAAETAARIAADTALGVSTGQASGSNSAAITNNTTAITANAAAASAGLAAEATARGNADTAEAGARATADSTINTALTALTNAVDVQLNQVPLAFVFPGKPAAGAILCVTVPFLATIPANLAGTCTWSNSQPTGNVFITVNKITASATIPVGTVELLAGSQGQRQLSTQAAVDLAAGEVVQLVMPTGTPDATMSDVCITLLLAKKV